jgi:hypothetical protein
MFGILPRWMIYGTALIGIMIAVYFQHSPPAIGAASTAEQICQTVTAMADKSYPDDAALITSFKGVKSDCAKTTVTLAFSVGANAHEMANVWSQADPGLRTQFCGQSVFKALSDRGWTVLAVYSLSDHTSRTLRLSPCPATTG